MQNLNIALYGQGELYPENPVHQTLSFIQQSGFTTLILGLFHIGRDYDIKPPQIMGDIYFNGTLVISEGRYVGDSSWPGLIGEAIGGSVQTVCASVGGGDTVIDYQTIKRIYDNNNNSFSGTNLEQNFKVFKSTFPSVSIIDMDCEETYDQPSFVAFCQMLIGIGFGITFCPYDSGEIDFWTGSLASLNESNPGEVKWWNLQCYNGGARNNPSSWAESIQNSVSGFDTDKFILAGDWTNSGTSGVQQLMSSFAGESSVGGGFIWTLGKIMEQYPSDPLTGMQDYVNAIKNGLG